MAAEPAASITAGSYYSYAVVAFLAAIVAAFFVYNPALRGPFVFDDYALPFRLPTFRSESLKDWVSTVRPMLMLSYWFNFQMSGREATLSYHVVNILIHSVNTLLAGAILWKVSSWTPASLNRRALLAIAGSAVFLLHPLQSESVAYIAGRSESLSALWCLSAWAVFLYRPGPAISWRRAGLVLLLFGAAVASKEHSVALAGVLLLTDVILSESRSLADALRRNWRLYAPLAAGAALACVFVWRVLQASTSAGLNLRGLKWYEYGLTQTKVLFLYLRLVLFPSGLTVDHDYSLSRSLDVTAGLALLFWIGGAVAAWLLRKRFPVVCYGFLLFLILLAPTSSVIPIKDLVAERRMYLPLLAVILFAAGCLSRLRVSDVGIGIAASCAVAALALATYDRSKAWGSSERLWQSAISATPAKARPYGNLASLYLTQRQCGKAVALMDRAQSAGADVRDPYLLASWALALECTGKRDQGIEKMSESVQLEPTAQAYASLGRMYLDGGKLNEAEASLNKAEHLDPAWDMTYVYRGLVELARNNYESALGDVNRALALNPSNVRARQLIEEVGNRSRYAPQTLAR